MISKKTVFTIAPLLAALGLLVSFFPNFSNDNGDRKNQQTQEFDDNNKTAAEEQELLDAAAQVDQQAHQEESSTHQHQSSGGLKQFPKNFNFQKETAALKRLKDNYPRSRGELIDLVLSANAYARAEPHSAAELAQRQKGALKVEALKALLNLEKDKEVSKRQLLQIAEKSKDPVMRRIAKAALDSISKDRPFFSDTTKALGNLPIPE